MKSEISTPKAKIFILDVSIKERFDVIFAREKHKNKKK
jgi:hypothetical protein